MTTVDLADQATRDDLARALIAQRHREIGDHIEATIGDGDCDGHYAERCGGCAACVYMQQTYADYGEQFPDWQARADELIGSVCSAAQFRASKESS